MAHLKVAVSSAIAAPVLEEGKKEGRRKKKEAQRKKHESDVVPKVEEDNKRKLSLIEAQRAVLMCPAKPETWAVLIAAINSKTKVKLFD